MNAIPTPCGIRGRLAAGILALWAWPALLFAGGGAFNTLIVVNTNSVDSIELGDYYAAARGIPAHHICRLGVATNLTSVTSNEFKSWLWSPVTNHIATNGLSGQIDFVVLCWALPTRVRNVEGVSASFFYGFKNAPGYFEIGCNLPAYTSNEFYHAERAYRAADAWNDTNGFIAFHLVASNLPTAKDVVDRSVAAQSAFPSSAFYLHMLGDQARGIRERLFANTQFSFTSLPGLPASCVFPPLYTYLLGKTNVIGYHDGSPDIPPTFRTNNTWLAGSYSDYLTSSGGMISNFTNETTQSTVLDWMGLGVSASYGTVQEPCAYLSKFPDPIMAFYYARGFSIGEAYAMAVEAPYQGLLAGDPLAAPFAAPPAITVTSQVPYQIVTGTIPVQVSAAARSNGVPAAALALYLDGRLHTNLAALGPTPSNVLSIVVSGRTNTATVATNHSLSGAVAALAAAVNADSNQIVAAAATGDRLQLIYKDFDRAGDNAPVTASVSQGTAAALTLGVGLAATNLHPSVYHARKNFQLLTHTSAGANSNDTLTCVITLTNGVAVTNILVAAQGEKVTNLLERLRSAVVTNTVLTATNGVRYDRLAILASWVVNSGAFFARTPGPDGWGIQVDYTVNAVSNNSGLRTNTNFSSFLSDYADDLRPRASVLFHVRSTNGILAAGTTLATTNLADGIHTLDFIAQDGSAVAAQSRLTIPIVVCNESPQLEFLGTNSAAVTNGEPASLAKGTDFGLVAWNEARTNTYALLNNGSAPLAITNWTTNGAGAAAFQVSGIPAVIAAGSASNFAVVFAPGALGTHAASLSFGSDALLPQTNLLLAGTGAHVLTVVSDHGTADPPAGLHARAPGAVLTNSIAVPAPAGGTQLVCAGWTMAGNDPTNGAATNFTMTVTNDATLVWLWSTNYWLDTAAGLGGSVDVADSWQAAQTTTQLTAAAAAYYHFTNWTGSVSATNNPLDLLMDAPKTVQANFAENLATNNTPEWWLAQHGWTNNFDAAATNDAEPDGFPTWQEYIADTDPTSSNSVVPSLAATGSTNLLAFGIDPTSTGRHYYIDNSALLDTPAWSNVTNSAGTGGAWEPEFTPPGPGVHFYRGRIALPP